MERCPCCGSDNIYIAKLKEHFKVNGNPVVCVNTSHINAGDPETAKRGLHDYGF